MARPNVFEPSTLDTANSNIVNRVLKLFVEYIDFINQCEGAIDLAVLKFHMDCIL